MPPLILYLLKANLLLLLFFAVYRLWLRQLTFYTYNRWFLLASLLLAAIFPLLDFAWFYKQPSPLGAELILFIPDWAGTAAPVGVEEPAYGYWALAAYAAGATVLAGRFILQMLSLRRIHAASEAAIWQGQAYRRTPEAASPFSFWRAIYLNPDLHTAEELPALLLHEQAHARQLHTVDVLLAQLATILCWFNPAAWLLQQEIRQNLEFLADSQVLRQGLEPKVYQYSLLRVSTLPQCSSLVMSFNFNHIKNRIMMMNKENSGPLHRLKYLLLPPAVLALSLVVTTSRAEVEQAGLSLSQHITEQGEPAPGVAAATVPQDSIVYFVDGKRRTAASIKSMDPNSIASVEVLKGEQAQAMVSDAEVKGVIRITTKQEGDGASVKKANVTVSGGGLNNAVSNLPPNAVYLLDDKEVSLAEVKQLSPGSIKAVSILKDSEKMVQKYGPKAKNGVIMIYTR